MTQWQEEQNWLFRYLHRLRLDFLMKTEDALIHKWTLWRKEKWWCQWKIIRLSQRRINFFFARAHTHHSKDKAIKRHSHCPNIQSLHEKKTWCSTLLYYEIVNSVYSSWNVPIETIIYVLPRKIWILLQNFKSYVNTRKYIVFLKTKSRHACIFENHHQRALVRRVFLHLSREVLSRLRERFRSKESRCSHCAC